MAKVEEPLRLFNYYICLFCDKGYTLSSGANVGYQILCETFMPYTNSCVKIQLIGILDSLLGHLWY